MENIDLEQLLPLILIGIVSLAAMFRKRKTSDPQNDEDQLSDTPPPMPKFDSPWNFDNTESVNEYNSSSEPILDSYNEGQEEGQKMTVDESNNTPVVFSHSFEGREKQEMDYDYDKEAAKEEGFIFDPELAIKYSEIMKPKFE